MNKITMDKQYRYRKGHTARILCVDGGDIDWPIVSSDKDGRVFKHTNDGGSSVSFDYDLIEVSPKRVFYRRKWIIAYDRYRDNLTAMPSKKEFDSYYCSFTDRSEEWEEIKV